MFVLLYPLLFSFALNVRDRHSYSAWLTHIHIYFANGMNRYLRTQKTPPTSATHLSDIALNVQACCYFSEHFSPQSIFEAQQKKKKEKT